jgi:hypothetical protein
MREHISNRSYCIAKIMSSDKITFIFVNILLILFNPFHFLRLFSGIAIHWFDFRLIFRLLPLAISRTFISTSDILNEFFKLLQ